MQSTLNLEINRELTKEKVAAGDLPSLPPADLSEGVVGDDTHRLLTTDNKHFNGL